MGEQRAVIVGIGSNLGSRQASIECAVRLLDAHPQLEVEATSPTYETEPVGPSQPRFLNAAARIISSLDPVDLLDALLTMERRLGRERDRVERWGPRSLDLDLLWDARGSHKSDRLRVPHAALEQRSFALTPLLDVAPELRRRYGVALDRAGGMLTPWDRAPTRVVHRDRFDHDVEVEADSIADACALAAFRDPPTLVTSTKTRNVDSSASAFATALRELFASGFDVGCAAVSHCSNTQWIVHFHGTNQAIPHAHDVRFATTSGERRLHRAHMSLRIA